jgi:tRNA threonylcarbamoyladenosine biosynthesis protein TsaE
VVQLPTLNRTRELAAALAAELAPGDTVLLCGDLGVGKTTIVEQIARTVGYEGNVSSPTFTLAHHYEGVQPSLLHVDAYRLSGTAEFLDMGLDFHGDDVVTLVEWGDRVAGLFPDALIVSICFADGDGRTATLESSSSRWDSFVGRLSELRE